MCVGNLFKEAPRFRAQPSWLVLLAQLFSEFKWVHQVGAPDQILDPNPTEHFFVQIST